MRSSSFTATCVDGSDRKLYNSDNSFLAPMKLDPLSENMCWGRFLLLINLFNVEMKAGVVMLLTTSRCMALVAKQMKTAKYPFVLIGLLGCPDFNQKGPA